MNVTRFSNRKLIAHLAGAGPDDPAWLEFVSRFEHRIRGAIYRRFRVEAERNRASDVDWTGEMVRDLTQDVFLRLLDAERKPLAHFKGRNENSFYTYLGAIASNLVHDHFTKLRAQKTPPAARSLDEPLPASDGAQGPSVGENVASTRPGPEHTAQADELRRRIGAVIQRLGFPKRDRLVFRFYFLEGRTIEELASCRAVGLSRSGVEKCVRRLRVAVQEELTKKK